MESQVPRSEDAESRRQRRFWAFVASLFTVGGGHLVLGRKALAGKFATGVCAAFLLTPFTGIALYGIVALWLTSIVSGFFVRLGDQQPGWGAGVLQVLALFVVLFGTREMARHYWVETFRVPHSSMRPTLEPEDHFTVFKAQEVSRGDVIVFKYPCDERKDFVKRVVGFAGDSIEVRCDQLFVNGTQIPRQAMSEDCAYVDYDSERQTCTRYRETLGHKSYFVFGPAEQLGQSPAPNFGDFPSPHLPSCADLPFETDRAAPKKGSIIDRSPAADSAIEQDDCSPKRAFLVPDNHVFVLGDNRSHSSDSRVWGPVPVESIHGVAKYIWWSQGTGRTGSLEE